MDTAQGRAMEISSIDGNCGNWNWGKAASPPAKASGSLAFAANVGTSKLRTIPTIDATARPISEEGTGVDGRNCVSAAQMSANAAASGVDIAPNCDMSSARPKAFRNPASTSLDTKSTALAKPTAPAANSMRAASNTTNGTSCSPWTAVKAPRGTTTTAAEPATTPGRIPAMEAKPRDTQDQRPTKGPVPTMALQARALDSKEKATLTPARTSSTGLNSSGTASSVSTSREISVVSTCFNHTVQHGSRTTRNAESRYLHN